MSAGDIAVAVAFAAMGAAIGWVYCLLVRFSVERVGKEELRMTKFIVIMLLRVALVAGGFMAAACFGTWPIIGNIAGFFVMRTVMVSRSRIKQIAAEESEKMKPLEGRQ